MAKVLTLNLIYKLRKAVLTDENVDLVLEGEEEGFYCFIKGRHFVKPDKEFECVIKMTKREPTDC